MTGLVSRVLAAIERAESEARHTEPGPWAVWPSDMPGEFVVARMNERTGEQDPDRVATTHGLYCAEQNARFIAHNDPAAVLRRCASERGIVDMYQGARLHPMLHDPYSYAAGQHNALWQAVQLIAAGYGISVEEETTGG